VATTTSFDPGYTVESYFDLVRCGVLAEDDHVELLEGMIVASPPQGPLHASVVGDVFAALARAVGDRALVRCQSPLLAGGRSVPEPDVAVVPGRSAAYRRHHPDSALLVVEVADSSLPQDRLTKSRIYAAAGVPEYWIVNLRDSHVEVLTAPDPERRVYAQSRRFERGDRVDLAMLPGVTVAVADLVPSP
jgi:Uma2 family endonuclease